MLKVTRKKIYRCLSYVGDLIILNAILTLVWKFLPQFFLINENEIVYMYILKVFAFLLILVSIFVLYSVLMYIYFGGTFGKFAFSIKIVDKKNKKVELKQILRREFTKWTMFFGTFLLYGLYCLYGIMTSKRLYHDIVADTYIK